MPEIPEKLKWYTPLKRSTRNMNVPVPWRVSADEMTRCVEIRRAPYFSLFYVVLGLCVGAIFGGAGYYGYTHEHDEKFRMALAAFMIGVPLAIFIFLQLLGAFIVFIDSCEWGHIRFRYDPANGELFFGQEKITYRPENYTKIIFSCVRGVDKEDSSKEWGLVEVTQLFVLILDKNNKWQRHTLSDDIAYWHTSESGSRQFVKLVEQLQQLLTFDTFVRDYSRDECYEQQNRSTG